MEKSMQDITQKNHRLFYGINISSLLLLATLVAGIAFIYSFDAKDPAAMMYRMNEQNHWLMLVAISVVLMFVCAITPLPAEAVTIANGMVFGPVLGTLITWISAMAGAGITFLYGRYLLQKTDSHFTEDSNYKKLRELTNRWGNLGLIVARLVPVVPFFVLNIGAAFLPVSTKNYFLITGICILPHIMVICFFSGKLTGH